MPISPTPVVCRKVTFRLYDGAVQTEETEFAGFAVILQEYLLTKQIKLNPKERRHCQSCGEPTKLKKLRPVQVHLEFFLFCPDCFETGNFKKIVRQMFL